MALDGAKWDVYKTMLARIESLYAWLMPNHLTPGSNEYTRGTVFITVILSNILFCLASYIWVLFGMGLDPVSLQVALGVVSFILVVYVLSLLVLKLKQSLPLAANIMMIAVLMPVLYGITRTGGIGLSPVGAMLLTTSLFGFVLAGFRSGVYWTLIAFAAYWLLFLLQQSGVLPAQLLISAEVLHRFTLVMPLIGTLLCVAAMVVYEYLNNRLRRELDHERHLFAFQATHDTLTGLPNRESFDHSLELNIEASDVSGKKLALVYLDLDGFKPVNDTYGHHAGDVVLQTIATRLKNIIRGADTVARLGGDEFAFLFCGYDNSENLERSLRKILESVAEDIAVENTKVKVSASLGVAIYPDDALTCEKLCRHADLSMYKAKEKKNRWFFFRDYA